MSSILLKTAAAVVATYVGFSYTQAQTIEGSWNGKLDAGIAELSIVFNFSKGNDGKTQCTMDSPEQGAKGIPVNVEYVSADSLAVAIPSIMARYSGSVTDGRIDGTFAQSGMNFKLVLSPGTVKLKRPQTPKPPFPYPIEEVTFTNPEDGTVLSGTLTMPQMVLLGQRVPAVVMVTGSGQQNRDEEIFGHKPFYVIADMFARYGVATLRYDDRGVDRSTGNAAEATTMTNMHDAMAGIDFLHKDGRFGRIGMVGHSEGGTIAFMSASEYPDKLDFNSQPESCRTGICRDASGRHQQLLPAVGQGS